MLPVPRATPARSRTSTGPAWLFDDQSEWALPSSRTKRDGRAGAGPRSRDSVLAPPDESERGIASSVWIRPERQQNTETQRLRLQPLSAIGKAPHHLTRQYCAHRGTRL